MNGLMSIGPLMLQRLIANWRLLLVLAFGILVASTLLADLARLHARHERPRPAAIAGEDDRQLQRNGFIDGADPARRPGRDPPASRSWHRRCRRRSAGSPRTRSATAPAADEPGAGGKRRLSPPTSRCSVQVQGITRIEDHVNFVAGRAAQATDDPTKLEVVIPDEAAKFLNADIGDTRARRPSPTTTATARRRPRTPTRGRELQRFRCTPQTSCRRQRVPPTIVGIIEPQRPQRPLTGPAGSISFVRPIATDTEPAHRAHGPAGGDRSSRRCRSCCRPSRPSSGCSASSTSIASTPRTCREARASLDRLKAAHRGCGRHP